MATSSSSLLSTPFLPSSRHLSTPNRLSFLRFQKLPLHATSPITSSFTSSQINNPPSTSHPNPPELHFRPEISRLRSLRSRLQAAATLAEKTRVLDSDSRVRGFSRVLGSLEGYDAYLVKCMVAAGQGHVLEEGMGEGEGGDCSGSALRRAFYVLGDMVESWSLGRGDRGGLGIGGREEMKELVKTLGEMEEFYDCIGGIIG